MIFYLENATKEKYNEIYQKAIDNSFLKVDQALLSNRKIKIKDELSEKLTIKQLYVISYLEYSTLKHNTLAHIAAYCGMTIICTRNILRDLISMNIVHSDGFSFWLNSKITFEPSSTLLIPIKLLICTDLTLTTQLILTCINTLNNLGKNSSAAMFSSMLHIDTRTVVCGIKKLEELKYISIKLTSVAYDITLTKKGKSLFNVIKL